VYLLDADILIRAKNTYFQFDRVPPFWGWLAHQAEIGSVWMPHETWVKIGNKTPDQRDDLALWAIDHKDNLIIEDRSYDSRFGDVYQRYAWPNGNPSTEADIEKIGDDYALAAAALHNGYTVVSNEIRNNSIGANKKLPNVCDELGVGCIDLDGSSGKPGLIDLLDFRIDWDA